jgi:hypothetical protein
LALSFLFWGFSWLAVLRLQVPIVIGESVPLILSLEP